jgi:hypothetical protein
MVSTFNLYLQVFLVVKELFTLPELMRSTPTLSGVHVARSWVFCEVFCRSLFVPLSFFFDQCIVTPLVSSNLSLSLSHIHTHTQTHTQIHTHTHTHLCIYWLVGLWYLTPLSSIFQLYRGGGNRSTGRIPPTCRKSLTIFIT